MFFTFRVMTNIICLTVFMCLSKWLNSQTQFPLSGSFSGQIKGVATTYLSSVICGRGSILTTELLCSIAASNSFCGSGGSLLTTALVSSSGTRTSVFVSCGSVLMTASLCWSSTSTTVCSFCTSLLRSIISVILLLLIVGDRYPLIWIALAVGVVLLCPFLFLYTLRFLSLDTAHSSLVSEMVWLRECESLPLPLPTGSSLSTSEVTEVSLR